MKPLLKTTNTLIWICQLAAAIIMLQTLFFKFSGAEESIYIFTTLGMEPWGRYLIGSAELVASALLLIPSLAWLGALGSIGIMSGALFFHLTIIGVDVKGDGGYLFVLCLIVLMASLFVLFMRKNQLPFIKDYLLKYS